MSTDEEIQGLVRLPSRHSVAATIDRLEASLRQRNILVFARIDFSADAARAGLTMRPEQMLIFGNPKAGTPLMLQVPAVGLDLPLKVLAWEDAAAQVWIAYNDPQYIVRRHGVEPELAANLAAVVPIIEAAAGA
ncbi:MAG: DUF302 domain-containing protein [Steroidobacteraceae bacterium]